MIANILVVDDDSRLRSLLSDYLTDQGFFVAIAEDAKTAREKLAWIAFDAMVLDRMMPGETGLELAKSLRNNPMPILMLTAMGEGDDRIAGLEAGAQDYLTKPFEPRELVLRLTNLLKNHQAQTDCFFGPYRFDIKQKCLWEDEKLIHLTTNETELLMVLAKHKTKPVSREQLADALGQTDSSARTLDVQINRLRKKLEVEPSKPVYIQTIRGAGYVLKSIR